MSDRLDYVAVATRFVHDVWGSPSTLKRYREEWWIWDRGHYCPVSKEDFSSFLKKWLWSEDIPSRIASIKELTNAVDSLDDVKVNDTIDMPVMYLHEGFSTSCHYIAFRDRLIDLDALISNPKNYMPEPITPRWFSSVVLDYKYEPSTTCPRFLEFIEQVIPEKEAREVMQEWFGYCLTNDNQYRKMMLLYGESGTGKSTLSNILEALIGRDNRSAVPLESLGSNFILQETIGKLVNFCGDPRKIDSLAEGVLKRFTGGDTILIDRKYKNPVSHKMTAKIMVATNVFPRVKDISEALWNRFLVVPMNHRIPRDQINFSFLGSEQNGWPFRKELPGIFNWAIEGLKRLRANKGFTTSPALETAKKIVRGENCSVSQFVDNHCTADVTGQVEIRRFLHEYSCFCTTYGLAKLTAPEVGAVLTKLMPDLRRRRVGSNGQQVNVYAGIKVTIPRD